MKLYCTSGELQSGLVRVVWTGTERNAKDNRKFLKGFGCDYIETIVVDVPTDKTNLLAFLNRHQVQLIEVAAQE